MPEYCVTLRNPDRQAGDFDVHIHQFASADASTARADALAMFAPQGYTEIDELVELADEPERSADVIGPKIKPVPPVPTIEEKLGDALAALPADRPIVVADLANLIGLLRGDQ